MTDAELVTVEGKRMQGRAIPVKTPYRLKDSDGERPYIRRRWGINTTSMAASTERRSRFRVRGSAICPISDIFCTGFSI